MDALSGKDQVRADEEGIADRLQRLVDSAEAFDHAVRCGEARMPESWKPAHRRKGAKNAH